MILVFAVKALLIIPLLLVLLSSGHERENSAPPTGIARDSTAIEALQFYLGQWRSDEKQEDDQPPFHYRYTLTPFNPQQTAVKMVITQVYADGREVVLWEGFKGWNAVKGEAYYYGFSTFGLMAQGHMIRIDANTLWT